MAIEGAALPKLLLDTVSETPFYTPATGPATRPRRTHAGSLTLGDQVVHLTRLLHREPFQMVTAIQQPGHCLWRVRKPLSPQAPDE